MYINILYFAEYAVAPLVGAWIETEFIRLFQMNKLSHPSWVRGLKRAVRRMAGVQIESHPSWVRGLKRAAGLNAKLADTSHPSWVRGLKLIKTCNPIRESAVAPLVGAWIETYVAGYFNQHGRSHPSWVRGLKHLAVR